MRAAKLPWQRAAASATFVTERPAPPQLGFGVRQVGEAVAHAARWGTVMNVDFTKAFEAVGRNEVSDLPKNSYPSCCRLSVTCHGHAGVVSFLYSDFMITSEQGLQQGDPLGPLCYCTSACRLEIDIVFQGGVSSVVLE